MRRDRPGGLPVTAALTSGARGSSHGDDERRVEALRQYGVLDGVERRELTALVSLAAQVCGVPMATLNLITASEQHQIASFGFTGSVTDRVDAMCDVVLHDSEPVVLADASLDERYRDNPWVTGDAHVRFYATHQLVAPGDVAIGTLCVFDSEPRELDDDQRAQLAELAERVVDVLELEMRSRRLAHSVVRLQDSERELVRSNAELADFAAQVSHDLRSPLTAILTTHELLEDALADDADEARGLLRRATDAARRMVGLVDGMLSYASAGGSRTHSAVDLGALLGHVADDLADLLLGSVLTAGPLPVVRGDELQLRVLLQNLVENAVKFARPGAPAAIEVIAEPSPLGVRVSVIDHGVGLPAEHTEELFEAYRRAAGTDGVDGTGLGLATGRKIVAAHGGRIGLEPTPGGGATAWFELPD